MMENEKIPLKIEYCNPILQYSFKGVKTISEINSHQHDFTEIAVILSGKARYCVGDEEVTIEAGDILIFNPKVAHRCILSEEEKQSVTIFFIGFTDVKLQDYEKNHIPLSEVGNRVHTSGELKEKIFKICLAMELENEKWQIGRYFMLQSYLLQILMIVLREESTPIEDPIEKFAFESTNKKYVVNQIVTYMDHHYMEKISLEQIAENMYLSPFYISRIFKSELGEAPITYLINKRLEKAKNMLETDLDMSVQNAAVCVGYQDVYYFSRLFKKKYGYAPSKAKHISRKGKEEDV
ncbi:MAG: AraC family transcriptional regulator [Eubacteriales bacterium]